MDDLSHDLKDDQNPFFSIFENEVTPVCGKDLLNLSERLDFSVVDATWFFGVTTAAWYEYTSDPHEKLKNRYFKKTEAVNEKRTVVLEKLVSGPDEQLYHKLSRLDSQLEAIEAEQEKSLLKLQSTPAKRALSEPVELPLALLYRTVDAMPFLIDRVSLKTPDIERFKKIIERNNSHTEFSAYLGRDLNAGYRWLKGINPPSPTIKRLMHALLLWFYMGEGDRIDERANWWINVVENEHKLLGRELGKGVPRIPSSGTEEGHSNREVGL